MTSVPRFVERLTANPWLNVVFLVLAVLGIIVNVASYVLGRRRKRPYYNKKSFTLVEERATKVPRIRILYDDERIENLTLTKVAIWNAGNEVVEPANFAPSDLLRLEVTSPAKILGVKIAFSSTPANNFRLASADNQDTTSQIEFDYFHRNQGVVVDLYHTGTDNNVKVRGTVKGIGNLRRRRPSDDPLTDGLIAPIVDFLWPILRKLPDYLVAVAIVLLGVVVIPIFAPLLIIDKASKIFRLIPKEFSL